MARASLDVRLLVRLLVWLGVRSECCGARTYQPAGWDRTYCAKCDGRL